MGIVLTKEEQEQLAQGKTTVAQIVAERGNEIPQTKQPVEKKEDPAKELKSKRKEFRDARKILLEENETIKKTLKENIKAKKINKNQIRALSTEIKKIISEDKK